MKNKNGIQILPKSGKGTAKRIFIFRRDNGECSYCGVSLTIQTMTLDHIIPKCKGGTDDKTNLTACCERCNSLKDNMPLDRFLKLLKRKNII